MEKIKVLMIVSNLFVANGVSSFAMNYLRDSNPKEIQFDFLSYYKGETPYCKEIESMGGKVFYAPPVSRIKDHIEVCKRILSEGSYDIIHDNTLHISIPMMYCAKKHRVPVRILHSHNSKLGETTIKEIRNTAFLPILKAFANQFTACSEVAGRSMFKNKKYSVIPNVIETSKYQFKDNTRSIVRKRMNADDKIVVGTVGRLAKQKNPFFALEIIDEVVKKLPKVEYWWIGDGPLEKEIKEFIIDHDLTNNVKLLGNRVDVVDLYQAMDAYLMPSFFEGLPLTGVEAQAMGIPMIVSDTITREMVFTDIVDFVNLKQPASVWAEHIVLAVSTQINRSNYSKKLRDSKFSNEGCGKQLTEVYSKMLINRALSEKKSKQ